MPDRLNIDGMGLTGKGVGHQNTMGRVGLEAKYAV